MTFEMLDNCGVKLTNAQLLGVAIGNESLARELMQRYKTFRELQNLSVQELQEVKGMGRTRVAQIKALQEVQRRSALEAFERGKKLLNPRDVVQGFCGLLLHEDREVFLVLPLDSKNKIIQEPIVISQGSIVCTIVHPREVFSALIKVRAVSAILVHNHPSSQDPTPSDEDIQLSTRLKETGKIIGIHILDHIIIGTAKNYYSFQDSGLI